MDAEKDLMKKLFGTDGIRAVAGESPLDPTTIYAVGLRWRTTSRPHASFWTRHARVPLGLPPR